MKSSDRTKTLVGSIAVAALLACLPECAPKKVPHETAEGCRPYALKVATGDREMTVVWQDDCRQMRSGYYVYISEQPLVDRYPGSVLPDSVKPFNAAPFPGDTNPDDSLQHFTAEGLDNGVKYSVSVRVVYPDQTLSLPSNEVPAVCGPRGEIELSLRFKSEHDGFSFDKDGYTRADAIDNDLYFYSQDGFDYLASPSRLGGFLRANRLRVVPFHGSFAEVKRKLREWDKGDSVDDRVAVNTGDWVHLVTSDNKHALIHVLTFAGHDEERSVTLFYAYCPLAGEPLF